jgi:hypothetical protein
MCHAPPYTSLFRQHKRHNTSVTSSRIGRRAPLPAIKRSHFVQDSLHGVAFPWLKVLSQSQFGTKPIESALALPH